MAMTLEVSLPSGQSVKLQLPGEGTVQELKVAAQVALGRKFLTLSKADGTLDPGEIYEIYVPEMDFSRVSIGQTGDTQNGENLGLMAVMGLDICVVMLYRSSVHFLSTALEPESNRVMPFY